MSGSTLVAHVDSTYKTRDELALIPTPAATKSWKPVGHHELVTTLIDDFARRDITVVREQYAVGGKGDVKLFGVMDLRIAGVDTPEIATSLGLRGSNDKSMSIQVIAAARVFVCDNMAFSGSDGAVVLKKKHTSGLDLTTVVPPAIEVYLDKAGAFRRDIDRMKDYGIADERAKALIYDSFIGRSPVLPLRLLPEVHRLYFDDDEQRAKFEDRTLWSLNNAYTEAIKALAGIPQQRYGVEIGRYFGKSLATGTKTQVLLPDGAGQWEVLEGDPPAGIVEHFEPADEDDDDINEELDDVDDDESFDD